MPNDLNLRISQRISVALVFLLASLETYLASRAAPIFSSPCSPRFFILLSYYWLESSVQHGELVVSLMVVGHGRHRGTGIRGPRMADHSHAAAGVDRAVYAAPICVSV